jgi:hypothetical protein
MPSWPSISTMNMLVADLFSRSLAHGDFRLRTDDVA